MAQIKKGAAKANVQPAKPVAKARTSRKTADSSGRLELRDYVNMNLIFAGFCIVQLVIVRMLLRDFAGLYFFFGFLICAFLIASIFDYFSEKLHMGVSAGD